MLNRSDTDTAYEAFISLKATKELEKTNPGIDLPGELRPRHDSGSNPGSSAGAGSQIGVPKRKRDHDSPPPIADLEDKRPRAGSPQTSLEQVGDFGTWDFLFPDPELSAVAGPGPSSVGLEGGMFGAPRPDLQLAQQMNANSASSRQNGTPATNSGNDGEAATPDADRQRSLRQAVAHMTNRPSAGPRSPLIITAANNMTPREVEDRKRMQEELRQSIEVSQGEEAAERKTEALQLITYHMNK